MFSLLNNAVAKFVVLMIHYCRLIYSEFDQIQREEKLKFPPKPPQQRTWRGSTVAPFSGNNVLVLYSCSGNNTSNYFVQVLHNEQPIPMAVSFSFIF